MSDVQVTFADGRQADILQKVYPLTNFIVGAFAGSVRLGMEMLDDVRARTTLPRPDLAREPAYVAEQWAPHARELYEAAPEEERRLGCRILLVGAAPTTNAGLGAQIVFARFASPAFNPGMMTKTIKTCSIGSGAGVREYKHSLKPLLRLQSGILQAEVGNRFGWGVQLGYAVSHVFNRNPTAGVSRHMHITLVSRGEMGQRNNNEVIHYPNGERREIVMPAVATNYHDFCNMAATIGADASRAQC